MLGSEIAGEKVVDGEGWTEVLRSVARRRKRAVFCCARRGVVGLRVGRRVWSQAWVGGRCWDFRYVDRVVARSGFGLGCCG